MIGIKSECDPFTGNQSEETLNKFFKKNDVHVKLASSVKEYAYVADKNRKFRNEMEDKWSYVNAYDKGWINQGTNGQEEEAAEDLTLWQVLQ